LSAAGVGGAAAPAPVLASRPRIAVVVVSFNVRALLLRCLESLTGFDEVVVVDNASVDGSSGDVRTRFPAVRIESFAQNRGFAAAVNAGARAMESDAILVLNPDTELPPTAATVMREVLLEEPEVAAFGFGQVAADGSPQLCVGPPPWLTLELARRMVQRGIDQGRPWARQLVARLQASPRDVPWVSGACLLVRRQAFLEVCGFDEDFFLFFEDIDFCLRLRSRGFRVRFEPRLTLRHVRGASAAVDRDLAERAYRRSQVLFWRKHRGAWAAELVRLYQRAMGKVAS
jgi:hypothetical protein